MIDGHNVIFRDSALRAVHREDQDLGRKMLLEMVSRYATQKSVRAVVAFDGGESSEGRLQLPSPVNVDTIFVADVDQYIRRRVSDTGRGETLTVVSSDEGHVALYSRQFGIRVFGVEEFMRMLREMDRQRIKGSEKPTEETRAGVEYWLRKFGQEEED